MGRSSSRMKRVWRGLPSELHEEIVAHLPIASVCRFKAVSKTWNEFICHPHFAARHAKVSSLEEYVLISEQVVDHRFPKRGWDVLDIEGKRSLNLCADFLAEFVKQDAIGARYPQARVWASKRWTVLAGDGGLLLYSYLLKHFSASYHDLGTNEALYVCNPVSRTAKKLPAFEGWLERPEWVVMATDRDSMEYEISFITLDEDVNAAYIYESKTASWRASAAAPGQFNAYRGCRMTYPGSVVLQNDFYALFTDPDGQHAELISYNKVTGAVSCLGIQVPCGDCEDYLSTLQLVASDGRLFCVLMKLGRRKPIIQLSSIEILEFILGRRKYILLSLLRGEALDCFLGNSDYYQVLMNSETSDRSIVAVGLANSILLHSFAGRSVAYDFLRRKWLKHPDSTFLRGGTSFLDLFASNHSLSLSPP